MKSRVRSSSPAQPSWFEYKTRWGKDFLDIGPKWFRNAEGYGLTAKTISLFLGTYVVGNDLKSKDPPVDLATHTVAQDVKVGTWGTAQTIVSVGQDGKNLYVMSGVPVGELAINGAWTEETMNRFVLPSFAKSPSQILGANQYADVLMAPDGNLLYLVRWHDCSAGCSSQFVDHYGLATNSVVSTFQMPVLGRAFALGS